MSIWRQSTGSDDDDGSATVHDVATEILAWRGWHLRKEPTGYYLTSWCQGTRWEGPAITADKVPTPNNGHGIYALKGGDQPPESSYVLDAEVYGQVALSGRVVEQVDGYRAERAVIRSLYLRPPRNPWFGRGCIPGNDAERAALASSLGERYGVECHLVAWPWEERNAWEEHQRKAEKTAAIVAQIKADMEKLAEAFQCATIAVAKIDDRLSIIRLSSYSWDHSLASAAYYTFSGPGPILVPTAQTRVELQGEPIIEVSNG